MDDENILTIEIKSTRSDPVTFNCKHFIGIAVISSFEGKQFTITTIGLVEEGTIINSLANLTLEMMASRLTIEECMDFLHIIRTMSKKILFTKAHTPEGVNIDWNKVIEEGNGEWNDHQL
jgi:hypothetical protein